MNYIVLKNGNVVNAGSRCFNDQRSVDLFEFKMRQKFMEKDSDVVEVKVDCYE